MEKDAVIWSEETSTNFSVEPSYPALQQQCLINSRFFELLAKNPYPISELRSVVCEKQITLGHK